MVEVVLENKLRHKRIVAMATEIFQNVKTRFLKKIDINNLCFVESSLIMP